MKLIPADKGTHFIAGNVVAVIATLAIPGVPHVGLMAATAAGFLKEVLDFVLAILQKRAGKPVTHSVDFMDFVATAAGGLSMSI